MAQRVSIQVVDDLDGTEGASTIGFNINGQAYEIDLAEANAGALSKALEDAAALLAPYMSAGRKVGAKTRAASSSRGKSDASEIRAWAEANGVEVPARGRIPASVREAYAAR